MTFEELVKYARDNECSDIHITVGTNLAIRRFGTLMILDDVPTADESREMIYSILDEEQRKYVSSGKDLDVGVMLPGGNRIRANIYQIWQIPPEVLSLLPVLPVAVSQLPLLP